MYGIVNTKLDWSLKAIVHYEQIYGIDYEETYAPVAKMTSLRLVLAISALLNLDVQQMDVETAFLNA